MLIDKSLRPRIDSAYLYNEQPERLDIEKFQFQYPFILSSLSDTTAKHFLNYCHGNELIINYCSFESIIETAHSLQDFLDVIDNVRSIYLRPPILSEEKDITLWTILHSCLLYSKRTTVIQPSLTFLNYSKPLQILKSIFYHQNAMVKSIDSFIKNVSLSNTNSGFIIKGLSDSRTMVVHPNDTRLNWLSDNGRTHPYLMQKTIQGNNYRVHVINQKVFPVRVSLSAEIDYRYSSSQIDITPCLIPDLVRAFCLEVTNAENLLFSGIDFIVQNDLWYCLEINPNPGYHPYDISQDRLISKELYDTLMISGIQ